MSVSVKGKKQPPKEPVGESSSGEDETRLTFPVQLMPPSALKPYFRNNKKHPSAQINELGRVLTEYGFDQPIVVDGDNVIIKGHGRYLAALRWVIAEVPVVVRTDLSEEEARAARIMDNRTFMLSETDVSIEQAEVQDYIDAGGTGAEAHFDFVKPPKNDDQDANKSPGATNTDKVDGNLLTCPKCSHVFMETS